MKTLQLSLALLALALLASCATASKGAAKDATLPRASGSLVGASIQWRVLVDGGRGGMTLVREQVIAEHDGELEVMTTEAHDPQETRQVRLVRIGPWDRLSGTGPSGDQVRYEKVEDGGRRPLTRVEGEAELARIEALLRPPLPSGPPVDVTTTETTDRAGTLGVLHCRTEQGRYPASDSSQELSYAQSTCVGQGTPWHDGFARIWRTQSGEEQWKREIFDGTEPGAFVCPATVREAVRLKRDCGIGLHVDRGCTYDGTFCACLPERTCSGGAARDESKMRMYWQCIPQNAPDPCGGRPPPR